MELTTEALTFENIDKSSWKTYRFDKIAKNISERVEPTETNLEIYVGLEHIDSESIHIKRFGKREDVSGTKLRCYPGDVIFGRRRAYQRKAAIVTFDGFCSAHSLVLRANPEVILPDLFPFFLHSDTFMHRAVDISVGSLSPTINWGDLKKQEFLLPPKDQQKQIAELLCAGDEMIEKEQELSKSLEYYSSTILDNLLFTKEKTSNIIANQNSRWPVVPLGKLISKLQYGISTSLEEVEAGVPILRMNNINNGELDLNNLKYLNTSPDAISGFILKKGDIIFNRTNSFDLVGKVCLFDVEGTFSFASYLIRIKTDESILNSKFLNYYLNSSIGTLEIKKYRTPGVSQSNINTESIKKFLVPLPPLNQQLKLVDELEMINNTIKLAVSRLNKTNVIKTALIRQFF